MEVLANAMSRKLPDGKLSGTVSGADIRKNFSELASYWAMVAAGKEITLDVVFSPGLPDYFRSDKKLFPDVVSGLLAHSVTSTGEGLVRVEVAPMPGLPGSSEWWLVVVVDDSGEELSLADAHFLNGGGMVQGSSRSRGVEKLGWLFDKWRRQGCETMVTSMASSRRCGGKYHWGSRYLVRIPCLSGPSGRIISRAAWGSPGDRVFREA